MLKKCEGCGQEKYILSWDKICYSCQKEKHKEDIAQQIKEGEITEIECESDIYCPHCGEEYEIDDEYHLYSEGEYELVCQGCEKPFVVEIWVSYSYSTRRDE